MRRPCRRKRPRLRTRRCARACELLSKLLNQHQGGFVDGAYHYAYSTDDARSKGREKKLLEMKWTRWLPGLVTLREYQAEWLRHDIVAGLVLATMLVPVGIAYAVASGVPGIYGLYATIVPLLAYALFGPSRILVLGPDSSLAPLILAVVLPLSIGDPVRAVAIASMMAIVSGSRLHCCRAGAAWLHNRVALQADPLRIHERNSADGSN